MPSGGARQGSRIALGQVSTKGGKLLLCKSFTFEADFASQNACFEVKPELHRRIALGQVSTKGGKLLLCKSFTFEADFASQNACFEVKPELHRRIAFGNSAGFFEN